MRTSIGSYSFGVNVAGGEPTGQHGGVDGATFAVAPLGVGAGVRMTEAGDGASA